MAWLAVDKYNSEYIFDNKPYRGSAYWNISDDTDSGSVITLPDGSIERLIGLTVTWESEPIEFNGSTIAVAQELISYIKSQDYISDETI